MREQAQLQAHLDHVLASLLDLLQDVRSTLAIITCSKLLSSASTDQVQCLLLMAHQRLAQMHRGRLSSSPRGSCLLAAHGVKLSQQVKDCWQHCAAQADVRAPSLLKAIARQAGLTVAHWLFSFFFLSCSRS